MRTVTKRQIKFWGKDETSYKRNKEVRRENERNRKGRLIDKKIDS